MPKDTGKMRSSWLASYFLSHIVDDDDLYRDFYYTNNRRNYALRFTGKIVKHGLIYTKSIQVLDNPFGITRFNILECIRSDIKKLEYETFVKMPSPKEIIEKTYANISTFVYQSNLGLNYYEKRFIQILLRKHAVSNLKTGLNYKLEDDNLEKLEALRKSFKEYKRIYMNSSSPLSIPYRINQLKKERYRTISLKLIQDIIRSGLIRFLEEDILEILKDRKWTKRKRKGIFNVLYAIKKSKEDRLSNIYATYRDLSVRTAEGQYHRNWDNYPTLINDAMKKSKLSYKISMDIFIQLCRNKTIDLLVWGPGINIPRANLSKEIFNSIKDPWEDELIDEIVSFKLLHNYGIYPYLESCDGNQLLTREEFFEFIKLEKAALKLTNMDCITKEVDGLV